MQLFWEKGYGSTSVADVLQAAKVNSGSLYHFFPGKQDLLLAVLDMYHRGLRSMLLEPAWRGVTQPIEPIFALLPPSRRSLTDTDCIYGFPSRSPGLEIHAPRHAVGAILLAGLVMPAQPQPQAQSQARAPPAPYQPLAFLVGHCWKGTFPDGKATDEHCFSWIYGGKFVRDEHVVHGEGHPDGFGESIYVWDSASRQLQYLYIESAGGFSRGTVSGEGDALVFPPSSYLEKGQTQTYR